MNPIISGLSTIAYRAPSAVFTRGSGSFILEGGYHIEDQVEINVSSGQVRLGNDVRLSRGTIVTASEGFVELGAGSNVGPYSVLYGSGGIFVGRQVMIGPHCVIVAESHGTSPASAFITQPITRLGVNIEDNVWLGAGVTVVDGVTIGAGSVIAAGSVVMKSVAPRSLVSGAPARAMRTFDAPERSAGA